MNNSVTNQYQQSCGREHLTSDILSHELKNDY